MIIDANETSAYAVVGVPIAYFSANSVVVEYATIEFTNVTLTFATLTDVTLEPD